MSRKKIIFTCAECGGQTPRWMGKCPECGTWDSLREEDRAPAASGGRGRIAPTGNRPVPLTDIETDDEDRRVIGMPEFDRVLGGGLVPGSLILIGGDPGIGKSTLMLQALHRLAMKHHRVLYVSGEESARQIRMRGDRLETVSAGLLVTAEVDMDTIMKTAAEQKPDVLVIDSIQTMYNPELSSAPGSVTQVRESAMRLMLMAKKTGTPTFVVGHVTKDGAIAGPRLLEHMVDTVLYFEGDRSHVFRILRAVKNRFGSTNEIGVFEMKEKGLAEVGNPSAVFLSERPADTPGSVVTACMEGSRPILVELQALASSTSFGTPRRTVLGLDPHRVALLVAVMEKRLGIHLNGHDIFMNVAGGVKISEPAADLGAVAAVASSFLDRPVPADCAVIGEVGLTGEVRAVSHLEARVAEIRKMGFTRCIAPAGGRRGITIPEGLSLTDAATVEAAVETLF